MTLSKTSPCICCSGKAFGRCCGRFLVDGQNAKTPEQLMRSRYSAYVLGGYGEYLLRTWFMPTQPQISAERLSQRECDWQQLEIVKKTQQGDRAMVEFKATYQEGDKRQCLHESSRFQREQNRWYYVDGDIHSS